MICFKAALSSVVSWVFCLVSWKHYIQTSLIRTHPDPSEVSNRNGMPGPNYV